MAKLTWLVVASLVTLALSDLYVSMPRCSNNRLNEQSANRNNGDRLFDSQNNNRGGYNCGDINDAAFNGNAPVRGGYNAIPTAIYNAADIDTASQYPMVYYEGSILPIEWANQHGCGGNLANDPNKLNCQIVIQYMCETPHTNANGLDHPGTGYDGDFAMNVHLRDGGNTNTPDEPNTIADVAAGTTQTQNNANQRGRHESEAWYFECKTRSRNRRLFTADQNLNGNTAIYTRQNPNGNRRGLECPEERDYYPYWVPNPWRDIAYLTDRMDMAQMIIDNSMNTAGHFKYKCKQSGGGYSNTAVIQALTPTDCQAAGGVWTGFTHNMADVPANRVVVEPMPWTRDNHLGNGRDGVPVGFNATLVMMDALTASDAGATGGRVRFFDTTGAKDWVKCVLRVRYNMSTDDYDPWNTTSASNQNTGAGRQSPVTQNPTVDVGSQDLQGLALAINTNQFGRTFQDRSHTFFIKRRPAGATFAGKKIWNLNVRGKRGNIVQVYPAVEYDFMPNILTVSAGAGDLIHMQWTGSNTHNNGDPGGDGQTGDAGEGRGGTDRHSWVQSGQSASNYPLPLDKYRPESLLMDGHSDCYDLYGDPTSNNGGSAESVAGLNCALILATSGQYQYVGQVTNGFNPTLDDAPASLIGGIVIAPHQLGTYNYIDTRNNNFSNRAQKGAINVEA